jgi:hypothetical protein
VLRSNFRWGWPRWPSVRVFPMPFPLRPRLYHRAAAIHAASPCGANAIYCKTFRRAILSTHSGVASRYLRYAILWIWPLRLAQAGMTIFIQIMGSNTGFCFLCTVSWQSSGWPPRMRPSNLGSSFSFEAAFDHIPIWEWNGPGELMPFVYHIVTLVRDHFSTEPSRHSICFNAGTKRKNIGAFRFNVPLSW